MSPGQQPRDPSAAGSIPVGRTVLTALLLRRFGPVPIVALVLALRRADPAARRAILTVAAAVYLGAVLVLVALLAVLVAGLIVIALTV